MPTGRTRSPYWRTRAKAKLELRRRAGTLDPGYEYHPRGSAATLQDSEDPEVLIVGPAGTGKSRAVLQKMHRLAKRYPGSRYLMVRKTRSSLTESALLTFERDVLRPSERGMAENAKRRVRQSYEYPNGSEIVVGGIDKPGKVMSTEYDLIYVQEAVDVALADWEALSSRLRSYVLPYQQIIGDTNPGHPTHWLRKRNDQGLLRWLESYHQDNPLYWDAEAEDWTDVGRQYIARLDRLTGSRHARLRLGVWSAPEGVIYEHFDADRHVVDSFEPPDTWPRYVGIDPVGAATGAVWLAWDPRNKQLHAYREYLGPFGDSTAGHARRVLAMSEGEPVFGWVSGQPSERQARADWNAAGVPCVEPPFADVWQGIDRVNELMMDNRLLVHECCEDLISEIGEYHRKLDRTGEATDSIEAKERFHLLDAARYIVAWLTDPERTVQVTYDPRGPLGGRL